MDSEPDLGGIRIPLAWFKGYLPEEGQRFELTLQARVAEVNPVEVLVMLQEPAVSYRTLKRWQPPCH